MVPSFLSVLDELGLLEGYPSGDNQIKIRCPFHSDDTPSFNIDLADNKFYCFGCHAKGAGITSFVTQLKHCDELEAMQFIVSVKERFPDLTFNGSDPVNHKQLLHESHDFFYSLPKPSWLNIVDHYIYERGFTPETLDRFDVRINPASQYPIILPCIEQRKFKGYISRRVDDGKPKYLYSRGFKKRSTTFGNLSLGPVLVVEGAFDVMMANQYGYANTTAILGSIMSRFQYKKVRKFATKIICGTDNGDIDEAGEDAYETIKSYFPEAKRLIFPKGVKDICEMSEREFKKAMRAAL